MPFRKIIFFIFLCAIFCSQFFPHKIDASISFLCASAAVASATSALKAPKSKTSQACKAAIISGAGTCTALALARYANQDKSFNAQNLLKVSAFFIYFCTQNRWNPLKKTSWKNLFAPHSKKEIIIFACNTAGPALIAWGIQTQKTSLIKNPDASSDGPQAAFSDPAPHEVARGTKSPPKTTPKELLATPPPAPHALNNEMYHDFATTPEPTPQNPTVPENLEMYTTPGKSPDSGNEDDQLASSEFYEDFSDQQELHTSTPPSPVAATPKSQSLRSSPPRVDRKLFERAQRPQGPPNIQDRIAFQLAAANMALSHAEELKKNRSLSAGRLRPQPPTDDSLTPGLPRSKSAPTPERPCAQAPKIAFKHLAPKDRVVRARSKPKLRLKIKKQNQLQPQARVPFGSARPRFSS